jgi:hypothetical protein
LDEVADLLSVSKATVRRFIAEQILQARQFCKGAPWTLRIDDLKRETVIQQAADNRRARTPPSGDTHQNVMGF